MSVERGKVRFASGETECTAWHYPGSNGACVVMAGGFAVTKEPATDLFAKRFRDAGFAVLAFDYRRLGESGGLPRQVVRIREQLADWQAAIGFAAIGFAATLPGVDPARLAVWGFSASGGHVFRVAARNPGLAAAVTQTPNADGPTAARNAARHQKPLAMLRFTGRGALDAIGGLAGRQPRLVPLAGEPGTVALLTTPDALDGGSALNPDNRYPDWLQAVGAPHRVLPARPLCVQGAVPAAGRRLRPGSVRAGRARRRRGAASARITPPPGLPCGTWAAGHEADRAVRRDHRVPGHRRGRASAGAVARADDGRSWSGQPATA